MTVINKCIKLANRTVVVWTSNFSFFGNKTNHIFGGSLIHTLALCKKIELIKHFEY